jgi:Sortase and related acyltransferases
MSLIREATSADLEAIRAIYNQAVIDTTSTWDHAPRSAADHQHWFEVKQAAGYPLLVADEAGEVIGYASYGLFRPHAGYAHTMEHSVYVRPDQHRRGVGRALLERLVPIARERGVHALVGGLSADNTASLALHTSLGFVEVARMPQVGRKFDHWLDLVLVELVL